MSERKSIQQLAREARVSVFAYRERLRRERAKKASQQARAELNERARKMDRQIREAHDRYKRAKYIPNIGE